MIPNAPAGFPGMTNLAAAFAAIQEPDFRLRDHKKWSLLQATDQASAAAGILIGRYYQEAIADGHAFYEICWIHEGLAYLRHIKIDDAYHAITLERLAKAYKDPLNEDDVLFAVNVDFVHDQIRSRDSIAAHLSKRSA